MRLKQVVGVIFMGLMVAGCAHFPKMGMPFKKIVKPKIIPPSQLGHSTVQTRALEPFTRVLVKGLVSVNLHTGAPRAQVILHGDPRDLANLQTVVANGELCLSIGKGYPHYGAVSVDIYTRYLTQFSYFGKGSITGHQLRSNALDLTIVNPGSTVLEGQLALRKVAIGSSGVTQITGVNGGDLHVLAYKKAQVQLSGMANAASFMVKDDAALSLYWVKSDSLNLRAKDNGLIQLAGIVDRLEVELWNHAHFNGRFLRAEQSFIKTHQFSLAEISTLRHQHTLATDKSNIYFYNAPLSRGDFMAFAGSVLDMRGWEQTYTRYNN